VVVADRITFTLDGDLALIEPAREHQEYIAGETLATAVSYESLDGRELRIGVAVT
jgi:hypothetical protein